MENPPKKLVRKVDTGEEKKELFKYFNILDLILYNLLQDHLQQYLATL